MRKILQFTLLLISFYSCDKANPRTVKAWIGISDTLVQNRIIKEQARIDSLCMNKTNEYFKMAYDSIYAKRWEEMKILLDSIHTQ